MLTHYVKEMVQQRVLPNLRVLTRKLYGCNRLWCGNWYLKYILYTNNMIQIHINNLREKFPPEPGFEPGSPALRSGAQLVRAQTRKACACFESWSKREFFS